MPLNMLCIFLIKINGFSTQNIEIEVVKVPTYKDKENI